MFASLNKICQDYLKSVILAILCGKFSNFAPINSSDYRTWNDLWNGARMRAFIHKYRALTTQNVKLMPLF